MASNQFLSIWICTKMPTLPTLCIKGKLDLSTLNSFNNNKYIEIGYWFFVQLSNFIFIKLISQIWVIDLLRSHCSRSPGGHGPGCVWGLLSLLRGGAWIWQDVEDVGRHVRELHSESGLTALHAGPDLHPAQTTIIQVSVKGNSR